MGTMIDRLFSRGVERRGDDYVVRYTDDAGSHERAFGSRREAKQFRATLGLTSTGADKAPPVSHAEGPQGGGAH
jgi:hypothetical protein